MPDHSNLKPWLLRSKVAPPRRRVEAVPRPLLLDKLQSATVGGLVVVYAPAGYGKSSLLADWRQLLLEHGNSCAWVCLEEDDDLESILAHVAYAFYLSGLDVSKTGLLQSDVGEGRTSSHAMRILLQIIQESPDNYVVVLDDLEQVNESVAASFLESFLRWAPENLTVALSSRQQPPVDLGSFAIRGLLTDIRTEDLKFNREEIRAVLGEQPDINLLQIEQRTEGWPALVRLMSVGKGLQSLSAFPHRSEMFTFYLDSNVLALLSKEQICFLMEASIFGDIPIAFFNERYGQEHLRRILHDPYDLKDLISHIEGDINGWRIHPLLREHLNARLHDDFPQTVAELHQAAARWLVRHGYELMAIRQAGTIGDVELIEEILVAAGGPTTLLFNGLSHLRRINDLISRVYSKNLFQEVLPLSMLCDVITKLKLGKIQAARDRLEDVTQNSILDKTATRTSTNKDHIQLIEFSVAMATTFLDVYSFTPLSVSAVDTLKSYREFEFAAMPRLQGSIRNAEVLLANEQSRFDSAIQYGNSAIADFKTAHSWFGQAHVSLLQASANIALGRVEHASTNIHAARNIIATHLPDDEELELILLCLNGEVRFETTPGHWEDVDNFQTIFLSRFEQLNFWLDILLAGMLQVVDAYLLQKQAEAAEAFLERCILIASQRSNELVIQFIRVLRAIIMARSDREDSAVRILQQISPSTWNSQLLWRQVCIYAEAASLVSNTSIKLDPEWTQERISFARQTQNQQMLLRLLAVECHRLVKTGQQETAFKILEELADTSGKIGYFRAFSVMAESVGPLISAYSESTATPLPFLDKIMPHINGTCTGVDNTGPGANPLGLTPKEISVLTELDRGCVDKAIARTLNISPNTVHFHLKNIYRKLGVSNRSQAARAARYHGVVEDPTHPGRSNHKSVRAD